MTSTKAELKHAHDFLAFVDASPTPFHAVASARKLLEEAGFVNIKERDAWASTLKPGGRYYLTRNGSTLVAFAIGKAWRPGNPVGMVGTHVDSCTLRIKPVSKRQADGYLQVGVETYGGGLWHTWFDRDLSIAGRVMAKGEKGKIEMKLVKIDRPILRIPTLAIHLDRQEKFEFNKETQLFPIAGLVAAELNRQGKTGEKEMEEKLEETDLNKQVDFAPLKAAAERHHPYIVDLIAEEAGVAAADILDFEMVLYDTQKAAIGGLNNDFIYSARLDNLGCTFPAIEGLIHSLQDPKTLDADPTIRLIALFDHEEIGSRSQQGADSNMLPAVLRRLSVIPGEGSSSNSDASYDKASTSTEEDDSHPSYSTAHEQTLATSFLISADMAHAVHPNYPAKYEALHRPEMNGGVVIKVNANVRYATSTPGIVLLQECAKRAKKAQGQTTPSSAATSTKTTTSPDRGVPLQLMVVRNDSSCGSTIGPMLSAKLGTRTIDVGNSQLSMHSCREVGGARDVELAINLFESFFVNFGELERLIVVD